MEISLKALIVSCLLGLTVANRPWNMRQFPEGFNVQRRVDGHTVFGSANEIDRNNVVATRFGPSEAKNEDLDVIPDIGNLQAVSKIEPIPEPGFIDSVFGNGAQARIVGSLNSWVLSKAKSNPGCVERFVCETYRTGESLNGIPYLAMSLSNAAVSFMVADMFDQSIDIKEITKAARQGRTIGTCHTMKCDFMDGQLRTLENYFEVVENFIATIYNSVAGSLPFRK